MPVLPSGAPYDTTETILNFARVIANDCALSISGNLLSDAQPYTYTMLTLAWRKLQDRLGNNAIESFPEETIISIPAMAAAALADVSTQIIVNFDGYFNGVGNLAAPVLPSDMVLPIDLWERPTGQLSSPFTRMAVSVGGLPTTPKTGKLGCWEWREDGIYMVGSNQATDVRIRYRKFLYDVLDSSTVPLIRCATALAYLMVEVFSEARGGTVTAKFTAQKEDAIKQIINITTRKKQRTSVRRQSYSRRRQNW